MGETRPNVPNVYEKTIRLFSALEGFLIYRALVTVFDTGSRRLYPLYAVGYGLPAAFAATTLAIAAGGARTVRAGGRGGGPRAADGRA